MCYGARQTGGSRSSAIWIKIGPEACGPGATSRSSAVPLALSRCHSRSLALSRALVRCSPESDALICARALSLALSLSLLLALPFPPCCYLSLLQASAPLRPPHRPRACTNVASCAMCAPCSSASRLTCRRHCGHGAGPRAKKRSKHSPAHSCECPHSPKRVVRAATRQILHSRSTAPPCARARARQRTLRLSFSPRVPFLSLPPLFLSSLSLSLSASDCAPAAASRGGRRPGRPARAPPGGGARPPR